MTERTNRRVLIVETAAQLFARQGYVATSTREIAERVGCTEAALYYHFKSKRELLGAVIEEQLPDMRGAIETCRNVATLDEALLCFALAHERRPSALTWLLRELPHFTEEERRFAQDTFLTLRQELVEILVRFIPNASRANNLAWLVVCASMGYAQIFTELGFDTREPLTFHE